MITNNIKYWSGLAALTIAISFTYYKSANDEMALDEYRQGTEQLQRLQIQLHRDLLKYRSNTVHEYDTLSNSSAALIAQAADPILAQYTDTLPQLSATVAELHTKLDRQQELIEDFKQSHAVLHNSMNYFSRLSSKIYLDNTRKHDPRISADTLGNLSRLILEYLRTTEHSTALKVYPLIDALNDKPTTEVRTLINHTLMILEKLPEIDGIISDFTALDVEKQLQLILDSVMHAQAEYRTEISFYNALLFIFSLSLIVYLVFIFIALQNSRTTLSASNLKLNREVSERTRTENTLLRFVTNCSNSHTDDSIHCLLNALCKSLDVRYAHIISRSPGVAAKFNIDIMEDGDLHKYLQEDICGTSDEEAMLKGRLVLNDELLQYFPANADSRIRHACSYIGIRLAVSHDENSVIAIADDKPMDNTHLYENILNLAAARLNIELSRQRAMENSKRYQHGLELSDIWIARLLSQTTQLPRLHQLTCDAVAELSAASVATLAIINGDKQTYRIAAASGDNAQITLSQTSSLNDGGLYSWCITQQQMLHVVDLDNDLRSKRQLLEGQQVHKALLAPVMHNGQVYGCLAVFSKDADFDEIDQQLLTQFSHGLEMVLTNMALLHDIQSEKERAEITLHSIADAVITTNADCAIEYMNRAAEGLCACSLEEVKGKPVQSIFRIIGNDTREPMHSLAEACLYDGIAINKSMTTLISQHNAEHEIECSLSPIRSTRGTIDGIVIVFHDETDRRRMEHMIKHQASHDSLTGLVNRGEFNHQLSENIYGAADSGQIHALCYLDLDRFKLVNDNAGHAAGDALLASIARILSNSIRNGDTPGRLGGDEFGLILKNCTITGARRICEIIIDKISRYSFAWEGQNFSVGVSIGITAIDADSINVIDVIKQADIACYAAKDHGRNRVYVYERKDTELLRRQEEIRWASKLTEALSSDRFKLYAQPICPLSDASHDQLHLEVLVRLQDVDGRIISPGAFIPAAERYNLMGPIDLHIIRKTLQHIASRPADENFCYSINLSGNSLSEERLVDNILTLIKQQAIDPQRICFEITETAAITNLVNARQFIDALRKYGFRFALDDFGSGLSSFEYLKNLPVDYLKIDGSFVRDMANNRIDHAMVAAINQVGHIMDIKTIAEFVENDQIINKLQLLNVDYAQGYGISRPQPIEDIVYETMAMQRSNINRRVAAS